MENSYIVKLAFMYIWQWEFANLVASAPPLTPPQEALVAQGAIVPIFRGNRRYGLPFH